MSYHHRDRPWLERLTVHIRPLVRNGTVDFWADTQLSAGDNWKKEIATSLSRAKAAVLLITADFLASDFINDEELPPLLAAAESGGCRVIPVIISPSIFVHLPDLARYQSINPPEQPLTGMTEHQREDVFRKIVTTLMNISIRPQVGDGGSGPL